MKKISVLLLALIIVFLMTTTTTYAASSDIDGPSVIHKEANQVFTIGNLLLLYDYDVFIQDDGFTGYGNIPGEYHVILTQDGLTKDVSIIVVKSWSYKTTSLENSTDVLFVADYKDIYVSNDRLLSLYEILYYIYGTTKYIEIDYQFRYEEFINDYHTSFNEDGTINQGVYELSFRLTYFSGFQASYSALIHTKEIIVAGIIIAPPASGVEVFMKNYLPWIIGGTVVFYLFKHRKKRGFNNG